MKVLYEQPQTEVLNIETGQSVLTSLSEAQIDDYQYEIYEQE